MALAELLERVSGRLRQREGTALDQLAAAATAHAAGKTVDVGAVEAALIDARLDIDAFKAMCEAAMTRAERQAEFDALAAAQTKADRLQADIDAADLKLAEARAAHARQYEGLRDRQRAAERDVERGRAARGWLLDPVNVAGAIRSEYQAALDRQQNAEVAEGRLQREIREAKGDIRSAKDWIKQLAGDQARDLSATDPHVMRQLRQSMSQTTADKIADHERRQKKFEAKLVDLEAQLVTATKELAAATADVERFQARILKGK